MSDKKPGLLSRLKNSISSTLSSAVEAVSDPGQEVALMLDDLATQIQTAEKDLHQAVVDRKVMSRKLEALVKDEDNWSRRAEQALRLGDEDLARQALRKKGEVSTQVTDMRTALAEQTRLAETMQTQVAESKQKLKALNLRRGSLMAQARAAKRELGGGTMSGAGSMGRVNDIEDRIAALEALNEVNAEMSTDLRDAEVDAKLAALDNDNKLDDELEALKAKLAGKHQLAAGKGEGS